MSTIKNQRCFTEATASARLILATGLLSMTLKIGLLNDSISIYVLHKALDKNRVKL